MFIRIVVVVLIVSLGVVRSDPITSMTTTTDPPTLSTSTITTTTTDPSIPDYTPEATTTHGVCVDKLDTCGLLDPTFYCDGDYLDWAKENCERTCSLCSGLCSYKGQNYTVDETWTDRCSHTCTCTGQEIYSCRAVCLNWNHIPSMCHLDDTPPGLYCQQPRCPHDILIAIPIAYKDQYPGYVYV